MNSYFRVSKIGEWIEVFLPAEDNFFILESDKTIWFERNISDDVSHIDEEYKEKQMIFSEFKKAWEKVERFDFFDDITSLKPKKIDVSYENCGSPRKFILDLETGELTEKV